MTITDRETRCLSGSNFSLRSTEQQPSFAGDQFLRRTAILRNYKIQGAINK
jgi:hypothetical protein